MRQVEIAKGLLRLGVTNHDEAPGLAIAAVRRPGRRGQHLAKQVVGDGSLRSRRTERSVLIASKRSMPAFSMRLLLWRRRSFRTSPASQTRHWSRGRASGRMSVGVGRCPRMRGDGGRDMNRWRIGDVTVTEIVEIEAPWDGNVRASRRHRGNVAARRLAAAALRHRATAGAHEHPRAGGRVAGPAHGGRHLRRQRQEPRIVPGWNKLHGPF